MQLQLTLDHGKRHEVLKMADVMDGHVDILEIGYPELITFGLDIVREIHEATPPSSCAWTPRSTTAVRA